MNASLWVPVPRKSEWKELKAEQGETKKALGDYVLDLRLERDRLKRELSKLKERQNG
jgi:hypothetical protein